MEKLIKIRQYGDGTTTVDDDIAGTDRSRAFEPGNRDGIAEHVAHLLAELDKAVPKSESTPPAPERENPITEQVADAAE